MEGVRGEVVIVVVVEGVRWRCRDCRRKRGEVGGARRGDAVLKGRGDGEVVHRFPGLTGGVEGGGSHGPSAFGFGFGAAGLGTGVVKVDGLEAGAFLAGGGDVVGVEEVVGEEWGGYGRGGEGAG